MLIIKMNYYYLKTQMLKYLTMRVFITVSTYQRLTWLVVKKKTNFVMKALKQGECMPISITWQGWNRSWCQYFTADFFLCHKLHISSIVETRNNRNFYVYYHINRLLRNFHALIELYEGMRMHVFL